MTDQQETHLQTIKDSFRLSVDYKFRLGASEHGGDLQDMKPTMLMDNCLAEVIDLYTYMHTLEQHVISHERHIDNLRFIIASQQTLIEGLAAECNDYRSKLKPVESAT